MSLHRSALAGAVALIAATAVSAAVPAGSAVPSQQATGRALLAGQVVEAGTTRPIAGVLVTLGGTPSASGSIVVLPFTQAALPGGKRQTLTNEQGHFLFTDLPAGTYSIQGEAAGYIPGGYGKGRAQGLPQTISLGETERVIDLRIALSRFATISGRVFDEAGEPLVGATVLAMRRGYDRGQPQFSTASGGALLADETDDRGAYRLATLIPGDYILSIRSTQATVPMSVVDASRHATTAGTGTEFRRELRASGAETFSGITVGNLLFQSSSFGSEVTTPPPPGADGTVFVYPTQFFPSAQSPSEASILTVRSGETRAAVDFHLRPVATSSVSGVVMGLSGPLPNLGLGLVLPSTASLTSGTNFETATTVSDSAGRFTFLGVPAGQYVLRATKIPVAAPPPRPTPAPGGVVHVTFQVADGPTLWASLPIGVGRTAITGLAVSLRAGFRVSGRIQFEGSAARPALEAMRGSAGRFEPLDDRIRSVAGVNDILRLGIETDGRLKSYELPPGRYYLTLLSPPGWTLKTAMLDGRDVSLVPFDLQSEMTSLVITYTDRPSTLGGTVRSPKGTSDGAAQVLVFPAEAASPTYEGSMRRFSAARAGAQGAYHFPALPAGDYLVVAVADDAAADFPSLTLVRSLTAVATRVTIGHGQSKTQDLTTATIR